MSDLKQICSLGTLKKAICQRLRSLREVKNLQVRRIKTFQQEMNFMWFFKVCCYEIGKARVGRLMLNHTLTPKGF